MYMLRIRICSSSGFRGYLLLDTDVLVTELILHYTGE